MAAPWQEHAYKVVVEFQKSNQGVSRIIQLSHRPDVLPSQLIGRVTPEVSGFFCSSCITRLFPTHTHWQHTSDRKTNLDNVAETHPVACMQVWSTFMNDCTQLAQEHPYTKNQSVGQCCGNLFGCMSFLVIGCGFFNPDGGDYGRSAAPQVPYRTGCCTKNNKVPPHVLSTICEQGIVCLWPSCTEQHVLTQNFEPFPLQTSG